MPTTQFNTEQPQEHKRRRRSNWAGQLERLVPGGKKMSCPQLELTILTIFRRPQ